MPGLRSLAALDSSVLSVTTRGSSAYLSADALARVGIAARELPGQKLAAVCLDDRCATLKDYRREGRDLLILVGPLAKALGLKAEFTAENSRVFFDLGPFEAKPVDLPGRIGQLAPNFRLPKLDGKPVSLADFRGKRLVIANWSSWCGSRHDLPIWQRFYARMRSTQFEILSIASDISGPPLPRSYADKYKVAFPVALDTADTFGAAFNLKTSPSTLYIDETGIVRYAAAGPTPEVLQQILQLLNEPFTELRGKPTSLPSTLNLAELEKRIAASPGDWAARLALAQQLDASRKTAEAIAQVEESGRLQPRNPEVFRTWAALLMGQRQTEAALVKLRQARELEPDNLRLRRQIWALEYPERFYTARLPDLEWQKTQLIKESLRSRPAK